MDDKKVIGLVTNWYPTKKNIYAGQFFKEQAFSVADDFDFIVIRYNEIASLNLVEKLDFGIINKEKNTTEYECCVHVPFWIYIFDIIKTNIVLLTKKGIIEGIGSYMSSSHRKCVSRIVNRVKIKLDKKIDIFYCIDAQKEAFITECLAMKYGKPYIISEHAPVPWPGTLISDVNREAIQNADMFFAISNDKIRQLMMQNIVLPKTVYMGNLVDEDVFSLNDKIHDKKTILIVAANSFYKNYNHFIAVINRLVEISKTDFRVMIVGYGANKGYSRDVESFENEIKNSKFYSKCELIREVNHANIADVYKMADVFVMTSIQEGQPVSAMEAACCGLPVFSTRCGGVEDYVGMESGRIFDLYDIEGMAKGLNDFIDGKIEFEPYIIRNNIIDKFGKKAFNDRFKRSVNLVIENSYE